ncbi:MAG: beta-ketoacyl-ACP synthase II [Bdellovibrionales bacterium]|nr:beta-ketoacyl-ACP synthase II [Bdellovibrionales bacterium]
MSSNQSTPKNIFVRPSVPQRRVVVTGLGAVTPLGLSMEESWQNLISGKSGISPITLFDASKMETQIAGEVKNFNVDAWVNKKDQKKMDRFIHLAVAAAKMGVEDASLQDMVQWDEAHSDRVGCIVGVGIGGLPCIERQHEILLERGPSRISPFFIPATIGNLASGHISMLHNARGPNYCITSACASGAHSIGESYRLIREGHCDVMIAGGAESVVCPMAIGGFNALRALSTRNGEPEQASRPWDQDRDGFVLAEGAAVLILEDYEHAEKRGAKIYAEVSGYGMSADAYHMTLPSPGGRGAALAMVHALNDAKVSEQEVGYINAHGTSTPAGDEVESDAIKRVFGDHAKNLWISSTKSMTGHALGAAGAIESAFSVMTLHSGIVPPTINLERPSIDCDLDYVPKTSRERKLHFVLNNSFGFGGTNASLLFGRLR